MIRSYGELYQAEFPSPNMVLRTLGDDVATVIDRVTGARYILTKNIGLWTELEENQTEKRILELSQAEWVMSEDNFENGWGYQSYPHCSSCGRGVYRHDAGSWCPFCGKSMKNPFIR